MAPARLVRFIASIRLDDPFWRRLLASLGLIVLVIPFFLLAPLDAWFGRFRFIVQILVAGGVGLTVLAILNCREAGKRGLIAALPDRLRKPALCLLGLFALASTLLYYNYFQFHGNRNTTHYWEHLHYQLGSRYFPELGYGDLYPAVIAADRETGHQMRDIVDLRDMESREIVALSNMEARIAAIPGRFSTERWAAFKQDLTFFRTRENRWQKLVRDHGYNPSPVWTMTGRIAQEAFVALGAGPATRTTLCMLLDPLLLLVLFLAIYRAFGADIALLAVVFWGANPIVMFDYTGGAFLRQDWMVATVLSFCLFKKEKHFLAGISLAYAVMTRVFPAAFLVYPAFRFLRRLFREKAVDRVLLRFGLGSLLAGGLLFGGSLVFTHGIDSWKVFVHNGRRHDTGVYTNHISFRNLFLFDPAGFASSYRKDHGELYHEVWRREKMARMEKLAPFYYGAIVLVLGALLWLYRDEDLLAGMGLGGFLPFLFFYPANYYFLFLFPLLFHLAAKPARLPWLYLFAIGVSIANLMSRGGDRNSTMVSFILLTGLLALLAARHTELKTAAEKP